MKKIIAIHDHRAEEGQWLKKETNYSWVNALTEDYKYEKLFFLRSDVDKKIIKNRLTYRLYMSDLEAMTKEAIAFRPDVIFLNICYFEKAIIFIEEVLKSLTPRIIIRIHHDFRYLVCLPYFLKFVNLGNVVIVPSETQSKFAQNYLNAQTHVYHLGFNVNAQVLARKFHGREIKYDLITATNHHPARNLIYTLKLHSLLKNFGFHTRNYYGESQEEFQNGLAQSKYFLLTSLTEASGSRVVLEAISAGAIPIVLKECKSAVELLDKLNIGYVIKTGIRYHLPEKVISNGYMLIFKGILPLIKILMNKNLQSEYYKFDREGFLREYDHNSEKRKLLNILYCEIDGAP